MIRSLQDSLKKEVSGQPRKLSGKHGVIVLRLTRKVVDIIGSRIKQEKMSPVESDFVAGMAKATIGQEIKAMREDVIENIDIKNTDTGKGRLLIEHAISAIEQALRNRSRKILRI